MKQLVQWNPYAILGEYPDDFQLDLLDGQDWVKGLDPVHCEIDTWQGVTEEDWETVMKLFDMGDYQTIFQLHNQRRWTDEYYCCDYYKKHVHYNVGIRKASEDGMG